MSCSKPLTQRTSMSKLRKIPHPRKCETYECHVQVVFQFEGNNACSHHICGYCLSKMYISGENPILFCPKCSKLGRKYVTGVGYEYLISTFIKANMCTSCFNFEAIYQESCGHLLCEHCVHSLSQGNLIRCSVMKCSVSHKGAVLAEVLLWRKFKLVKFRRCGGKSCRQMAILAIKECSHGFCVDCLSKLLMKEKFLGLPKSEMTTVHCDIFYCFKAVPSQSIKIFLSKLEDVRFMTTVVLEITPVLCYSCGNCDAKNMSKFRLRCRQCPYQHSFCFDCILAIVPKCSEKSACLQTKRIDDHMICQAKGCKMKTPVCCLRDMIEVITDSKESIDIFLRKASFYEECSKCNREKGILAIVACDHALCKDCLRRIVNEETRWYHECEGDFGTCKYRIPSFILKCWRDQMKCRMSSEQKDTFNALQRNVFDAPDIILTKTLDENEACLLLYAKISSSVPVGIITWMKNKSEIRETMSTKFRIINNYSIDSTLTISSLDRSDVGTYTCIAENCNGRGESNPETFILTCDPPIVRITQENSHESTIITAEIYSKWPLNDVKWMKNGRKIFFFDEGPLKKKDNCHFSQNITLNLFESQIGGRYKCVAANVTGENESEEILVQALDRLPIVSLSITVDKSRDSLLFVGNIKATSLHKPVIWIKNGLKLDLSNLKKFSAWHHLDESPKLQICNVDETDEGDYELRVKNSGGESTSNPVPFHIEKGCDRPKIKVSGPLKDSFSITLTAEIESEWPIKSFHWRKNGELIPQSDTSTYIQINSESSCKLRIFNVKETGSFQAIAENVAGISKSECISLTQKDPVKVSLKVTVVPALDRVELHGQIESVQTIEEVMWIKNGKTLVIDDVDKYTSVTEHKNNPKLIIMRINKEDEGKYCFIAKNQITEVQSNPESFIIKEGPPKIIIQTPVKDGKNVIVDAIIGKTIWPVKNITWKRNSTVIKREEKFIDVNEISTSRLILSDVKETAGLYKVIAENAAGKCESDINLLHEEIQDSIRPILEINVDKSQQRVIFEATFATATKLEQIVWMKNDKRLNIRNDNKYHQSVITNNKCVLLINQVNKRDEGVYKVVFLTETFSEESDSVHFEIEQEPPKIVRFNKNDEKLPVTFQVFFESEWPVRSIEWYRNNRKLKPSQEYCMDYEGNSCKLELKGSGISGRYRLELESVGGTMWSDTVEIKHCDIKSSDDSGSSPLTKTKESILQPVISPFKGCSDCEICDYTAMAKVKDCGHHFCWKCLELLADDPQASENINCRPPCPSWFTKRSIQKLIHDDENSKKQTSLYFKLDGEGYNCVGKGCTKKGFIKIVFCSHIYCVECIQNYDGNNICVKSGHNCERNPEQINFIELQKSFESNTVNPFLFECHGRKCDFCYKEIVVFEIYRCGHRFCESCIQALVIPKRDEEPFPIGKCLQEQCQEYFKFPWSSTTKQMRNPLINTPESKQPDTKPGSIEQKNASTLLVKDKMENEDDQQNLSAQKRKQKCTKDSFKKPKTVVARFQRFTGLSNVGLSCYRNAILQTLAETPFFHKMLEPYKEKTDWIRLLSIILERIRDQNTDGQEMVDCLHQFHYEFNKKHSEYREFQQEDTLSFLTSILNGVQEEFMTLKKIKDPSEGLRDPASLFRGLLKDKYFCKRCKQDEFFEGESFFSLPLPVAESMSKRGKATLGSCLKGFLSKEDVDGIPCTYCESNEVTKELIIDSYPDVLVLQICKLEEASNSTLQRNRSHVAFWETFNSLKTNTEEEEGLKEALKLYRLFSVVEHIGSERSGHYICYVRRHGDQEWNRCDDSYVKEVKLQEVRKCDAYLLFYEKCSTAVN